jgi:hypothetical protein
MFVHHTENRESAVNLEARIAIGRTGIQGSFFLVKCAWKYICPPHNPMIYSLIKMKKTFNFIILILL